MAYRRFDPLNDDKMFVRQQLSGNAWQALFSFGLNGNLG
jgi:hypothetical protein